MHCSAVLDFTPDIMRIMSQQVLCIQGRWLELWAILNRMTISKLARSGGTVVIVGMMPTNYDTEQNHFAVKDKVCTSNLYKRN